MSAVLLSLPFALGEGEGEGWGFVRLSWRCAMFEAGAGASSRQPRHFLLLRQKKVTKEKATPLRASLRFAAGNLRCSLQAGSAQTRFAQTRAALFPPEAALLGTRRGECVGPLLRSACNGLAARGLEWERVRAHAHVHGPTHTYEHGHGHEHVGLHGTCLRLRLRSVSQDLQRTSSRAPHKDAPWRVGVEVPSGRSRGAQLFADQGRTCLSEASLRGPREKRAPQASRSEAQGVRPVGSPFLWLLSFGEAKESDSPAGATSRLQPPTHSNAPTKPRAPHPSPKQEGVKPMSLPKLKVQHPANPQANPTTRREASR